MNLRNLGQTLLLAGSTIFAWYWANDPLLSQYNLQLAGVTVILYTAIRYFQRLTNHKKSTDVSTLTIINILAQVFVHSTGGTNSPFFFLIILLLFASSLIFEYHQSATISITSSIIFIFQGYQDISINLITSIIELLLITPISIAFGNYYLSTLESQGKIKVLETQLEQEETDGLLWITTSAKPSITSVFNSISDIIIYLKSSRHNLPIPKALIEKISKVQTDLLTLYNSAEELQSSLESKSDNKKI